MVVMIWYGAGMAASGSEFSSPGTVVAFLAYLQQFYHPIGALARVLQHAKPGSGLDGAHL